MAAVAFMVGLRNGEYVVTRFERKVREFGLTPEEVDRYIAMLVRCAQEIRARKLRDASQ